MSVCVPSDSCFRVVHGLVGLHYLFPFVVVRLVHLLFSFTFIYAIITLVLFLFARSLCRPLFVSSLLFFKSRLS